ncbi:class I tRNA ligase family protein [Candidatus Curtissbacteria bacterium]|nr:class I tRNA ligase family protein [Candidatus Curtissbacteria bacterium]
MRWMYARQNPVNNLLFGYHKADEVRRRFYLILWNVYSFFVTYANLNDWSPQPTTHNLQPNVLDNWVISRLNSTIKTVNESLTNYDAQTASLSIENFVIGDLSTWYIRRSRDRVEEALPIIYQVLVDLSKLLSPFTPFKTAFSVYTIYCRRNIYESGRGAVGKSCRLPHC